MAVQRESISRLVDLAIDEARARKRKRAMKLKPALMAAPQGPIGVWLLDDHGNPKITISIDGASSSRPQRQAVAVALVDRLPDDGIEIPDS